MDIVIAGGSAAAFESALAARKQDPDCRIVIHSAENVPPYRRPALPGLICADEAEFAKMFIRKEEFYQQNNITLCLNSRLTAVDAEKKEAVFNGTEKVPYDRLILATGGKAFVPSIPGADGPGVLTLRTCDDLLELRKRLAAGARRVTLIGGGILGLELADSLLHCGAQVTLLERSDRLLCRNLVPEDSDLMKKTLASLENFRLICCADISEITPAGVLLASGELVSSDIVLLSTGSRPALEGLPSALCVEKAIVVNEFMQTNLPDIYACGDNSQFNGKVCGLYSTARAMAIAAGANAAGARTVYQPKENTITLNTLGFKLSPEKRLLLTGPKA